MPITVPVARARKLFFRYSREPKSVSVLPLVAARLRLDSLLAVFDSRFQGSLGSRVKGRDIKRLAGLNADFCEALAQVLFARNGRDAELQKEGHLAEERE